MGISFFTELCNFVEGCAKAEPEPKKPRAWLWILLGLALGATGACLWL